jgi:pSer/pThr/pTyr-binding forkhead associated (FHA) protein
MSGWPDEMGNCLDHSQPPVFNIDTRPSIIIINMPTLDELESHLQYLVEVKLLKYLPGYNIENRITQQLAIAMKNSLREQDGAIFAPNVYVIIAHPSTLAQWHNRQNLFGVLADALQSIGEEAGFHFFANPTVSTVEDPKKRVGMTEIVASFGIETVEETQGMQLEVKGDVLADNIPQNAFLILAGSKIIPLNLPVINIGRRLNNQIIIDDERVSRTHAQFRITKGRFMIFDLNSTGGTFVNRKRINQSILFPGDVISLAGVTLIFGQDQPTGQTKEKVTTAQKTIVSNEARANTIHQPGIDTKDNSQSK